MAYSFKLRFTGLCGFVPHENKKMMRVVLGNARDNGMPEHYPIIIIPEGNYKAGRTKTFSFDGGPARFNGKCLAFVLDGEDITIDFPSSTGDLTWDATPGEGCPKTRTNERFGWIAGMAEAGASSYGDVDDSVLLDYDENEVLARLKLTSGKLTTNAFADTKRNILTWQFYDPGPPLRYPRGAPRALAEEIQLQMDSSGESDVTLHSKKFDGTKSYLTLTFGGGVTIEAWVVNMPLLDVLSDRSQDQRGPDYHFAHFYNLSTPGVRVPCPVGKCDRQVENVTNPRCPPASFNPNPNA